MMGRASLPALVGCALALACAGGGTGNSSSLSGATSIGSGDPTTTSGEPDTTSTPESGEVGTVGSSGEATTAMTTTSTTAGDTDCNETTWYLDGDGDGRGDPLATTLACEPPPGYVPFGDDCDDADPSRSPAADEICDGIDTDCDGLVDEASAANTSCNGCDLFDIGGH